MKESEIEKGPGDVGLTYQDENSTEVPVQAHEANVQTRLRRDQQDLSKYPFFFTVTSGPTCNTK